jgi:vitamin B12 transporter
MLRLTLAPDFTSRNGEERLRVDPTRIDPLTTTRNLFQLVSGLEHTYRDGADRVENVAFVKHYLYHPSTDQVDVAYNEVREIEDTEQRLGGGDAVRVRIVDGLIAKGSYEYALRLPRPDELFGDGALLAPNLELEPETSHNANLGALLESELHPGVGTLALEVTGFLRHTRGMIVRLIAEDRVHSIHQNVFTVRTLGADGMLRWDAPRRWLSLQTNATYLDQRNASERGPFAAFEGQRVPNRPWLFSNASATVRAVGVAAERDELSFAWVTRYVHSFLPGWGDTSARDVTNRIPTQITQSASVAYSVRGAYDVHFALDVSNLTDERVYDVLGVQRPGRAAFLKVTLCRGCTSPARVD